MKINSKALRRSVYAVAAGVALAASAGGITYATVTTQQKPQTVTPAYAPYARAGAIVRADGTLSVEKNVESVTKSGDSTYCVKLNPTDKINLSRALVEATPLISAANSARVDPFPRAVCGNAPDTITVMTSNAKGDPAAGWFSVVVL